MRLLLGRSRLPSRITARIGAGFVGSALACSLLVSGTGSSAAAGPVPESLASGSAVTPQTTATAVLAERRKGKKRRDPRTRRGLFVDNRMAAYQAGGVFRERLGRQPQALWITDYYHQPGQARRAVKEYSKRANQANKTPLMAVYAIPGRDCGLFSSGGLSSYSAYRKWSKAAAKGMRGQKAIVVVEPDAIAFMGDPRCVAAGPRQRAIAYAVKQFSKAGAWVYIDAGHSEWRSPAVMAGLLKKSGMRYARGFATNIGNHRPTSGEKSYGKALTKALAKLGLKRRKQLIETARNGANPAPVNGDVCNPTSARVGRAPKLTLGKQLDGFVWIKLPGESDGECNGGPSSGQWWPEGARQLLGLS